jgi:hypothetical protein
MASFRLSLTKSRSANFERVIEMLKQLPGFIKNEDTFIVECSLSEIFVNWKTFFEIYRLAANWTGFAIQINNEILGDNFNQIYEINSIKDCYQKYLQSEYKYGYCRSNEWACSMIKSIELTVDGIGKKWYKYGHFEDNFSTWILHKNEIKTVVEKEIDSKFLKLCPAFNFLAIIEAIDNLPTKIDLSSNNHFEIIYKKKFVGAEIKNIPESISHTFKLAKDLPFDINISPFGISVTSKEINPYVPGTNEWSNWEIEYYKRKKK